MRLLRAIYLLMIVVVFHPDGGFAQSLRRREAAELGSAELAKQSELQRAKLETDWKTKSITLGRLVMNFDYRILGEKPLDGRSLYISLHGGGNTTKEANDQQWRNQISLYTPQEGVYLAPRAPTNTWNLWHEDHIDSMLVELIKAAVLAEQVNPNKVYLMGYSAGGDGTFQLAPRMAGYWAAAAMMAGHPGDASALSLRNLPFAIYMGGADSAYKRNEHAVEWGAVLDSLQNIDSTGYIHDLHVYKGMPHWMSRKDTVAISWLASFRRNPLPRKVAWHQDDVHHSRFYWLGVPLSEAETGAESVVSISNNSIQIEKNENRTLFIYLNDQMVNLDAPVKVCLQGKILFHGKLRRNPKIIAQTAAALDENSVFSVMLVVKDGTVNARY